MLRPLSAMLGLCLLLSACQAEQVYADLSEQHANEMAVVLLKSGIEAEKRADKKGRWAIYVPADQFAPAVDLLRTQGYPRAEFSDLGEIFKKEGLVSTPLEERARLMYGLSQELSHTLSNVDGVLVARVHIVLPETDPLSDVRRAAAASVFIKHRAGMDLSPRLAEIKALVVNSVDGLTLEQTTVTFFPAESWPVMAPFYGQTKDPSAGWGGGSGFLAVMLPVFVIAMAAWLTKGAWRLRRLRGGRDSDGG